MFWRNFQTLPNLFVLEIIYPQPARRERMYCSPHTCSLFLSCIFLHFPLSYSPLNACEIKIQGSFLMLTVHEATWVFRLRAICDLELLLTVPLGRFDFPLRTSISPSVKPSLQSHADRNKTFSMPSKCLFHKKQCRTEGKGIVSKARHLGAWFQL